MRVTHASLGPLRLLSGVLVTSLVAFVFVAIRIFPGDTTLPRPLEIFFWGVAVVTAVAGMATAIELLRFERNTKVGRAGLKVFLAGAAIAGVMGLLSIFRVPGSYLLLAAAYPLALGGWMAFALTNLWARVLPRWNMLPLVIGLIPVGITIVEFMEVGGSTFLELGISAFAASWLLLSFLLWLHGRNPPGASFG